MKENLEDLDILLQKKGFSSDQIHEIRIGMEAGLPVASYTNKDYMAIQMYQIRLGLQEHLPVEYYARPYYDWFQMEEIRKGLEAGLDVSIYAKPDIPYAKMRELRKGLEKDMNLSPFLNLRVGILRQLRKSILSGISIIPYIKEGYDEEQLKAIRHAVKKRIPIEPWLNPYYKGDSIREISTGLSRGLDVSQYANPEFSWRQMREIRLGLEHRLDISLYADPLYSYSQMEEIRTGLEKRLDVSRYSSLMYTAKEMRRRRLLLEKGESTDIEQFRHEPVPGESFYISVSEDSMTAYIHIVDSRHPIKRETILAALLSQGVCYGIDEIAIDGLLSGKYQGKGTIIAQGTPAIEGADGWYEYFFRTDLNRKPKELPDGSVDYHCVEWFELVNEDQKIAYYHEPGEGTPGKTVTGQVLPAKAGKEQPHLAGTGFKLLMDQKTYISTMKGRIELKNERMDITSLLLLEDVTAAGGDIDFDGSIQVNGNIGMGAVLHATGDIVVNGYVEAAELSCGGNILIRQGVSAGGAGYIRASQNIVGHYFESASLYAEGEIQAAYCLNSNLFARGIISALDGKGMIAGGSAYSESGFDIRNAGNAAGVPTRLTTGITKDLEKENAQLTHQLKEIQDELGILGHAYEDYHRRFKPEIRNTMKRYLELEEAIDAKQKQLSVLESEAEQMNTRLEKTDSACVIIRHVIYDNVVIEISGTIWRGDSLRQVTFRKSSDGAINLET